MSGHGFQKIEGLRAAFGSKVFVDNLGGTTYRYKRTQEKTGSTSAPYWSVKQSPKTVLMVGYDGTFDNNLGVGNDNILVVGDMDWQNDKECVTWFNSLGTRKSRYEIPNMQFVNTRLYYKGKKSQSCPKKIIGAAICRLINKAFLAVGAELNNTTNRITLSLWKLEGNFEDTDFVLVKTFDPLEPGVRLDTSVLFNQIGTKAVAVVNSILSTTEVYKERLQISVINNNGTLDATLTIEDPYSSSESRVSGTVWDYTQTITGTSLIASEYLYIKDRTDEDVDQIVDFVLSCNNACYASYVLDGYESTDENGGIITTVYHPVSETVTIRWNTLLKINVNEQVVYSFPESTYSSDSFHENLIDYSGHVTYDETSVFAGCSLIAFDLRSLLFFVNYESYTETKVVNTLINTPPVVFTKTGQSDFRIDQVNLDQETSNTIYEYSYEIDDTYESYSFPAVDDDVYSVSSTTVETINYQTFIAVFDTSNFVLSFYSLLNRKGKYCFLSSRYIDPGYYNNYNNPKLDVKINYLHDDDLATLRPGIEDFYYLSVL
jgi:5-hydroxyisourate hydrolase-like protein (transthyretin family)